MGIKIMWDNDERTIMRYEFEARWSWADLYAASDEGTARLDSVDHRVDVIADLRGTSHLPGDFMQHAGRIAGGTHPHRGIVVVVGASPVLRGLSNTVGFLYRKATKDLRFADSLEEARTLIAKEKGQNTRNVNR